MPPNKNDPSDCTTSNDDTAATSLLDSNTDNTNATTTKITGTGSDSDGKHKYQTVDEMWESFGISKTASRAQLNQAWYDKAADWYETNCPPTVEGVLGGFARISDRDLAGSKQFLDELRAIRPSLDFTKGAACECGAGIGRVTKGLLLDLNVTQVDVVESSERLLCESPDYIGEGASKCRFYCSGLQEWEVPKRRYSVIWIQWVLCYLTDHDCIEFFKRCGEGLVEGGIIMLKENTCGGDDAFVVDPEDASVCRSLEYWLELIKAAGLRVIHQKMQTDFPDDLFPVPMLALEPETTTIGEPESSAS